jgi:hypothetical protein
MECTTSWPDGKCILAMAQKTLLRKLVLVLGTSSPSSCAGLMLWYLKIMNHGANKFINTR